MLNDPIWRTIFTAAVAFALGLILGKLAFSPLWPLRVLILGGGMLGLTLLLSRFFQGGPAGGRESFALALFLVVWAPWGIWQQVYSWSAAWANYLAPTLLLLPLLLLLRQGRPDRWPLVLLLSLSIGLFTEHNTAYLVLLSSAMALAGLVPALRGLLPAPSLRAALLSGSWAGLALSMTNSVFAQVDSGLRGVGLDLARDNLPVIFTEVNGSDATAQAISRETGCAVAQLTMLMDGPEEGDLSTYLEGVRSNVNTIVSFFGGEELDQL